MNCNRNIGGVERRIRAQLLFDVVPDLIIAFHDIQLTITSAEGWPLVQCAPASVAPARSEPFPVPPFPSTPVPLPAPPHLRPAPAAGVAPVNPDHWCAAAFCAPTLGSGAKPRFTNSLEFGRPTHNPSH